MNHTYKDNSRRIQKHCHRRQERKLAERRRYEISDLAYEDDLKVDEMISSSLPQISTNVEVSSSLERSIDPELSDLPHEPKTFDEDHYRGSRMIRNWRKKFLGERESLEGHEWTIAEAAREGPMEILHSYFVRMNIESIQVIRFYITLCTSYVLLIFGNIGFICNFITFTSKQLRQNSCGWYLLMSTLFDCSCINFGLFTKLASEHYGSKLQHTNLVWCKIRIFLTWILQCFSTGYLILASIDRCLSTPKSQRIRSFSQIKIAHQMTCIPIILYSLTSSHLLVYFNLRKRCSPTAGTYAFFLSIYSMFEHV
ncbi:unnamed protein product [Rotaria sp. Silwood1]|nr:unnamed protein product [Rotaria sp. Silwood1]